MYHHVVGFLGIAVLSAMAALATIICTAMRLDKDPAVDGPRALISEFFGLWLAFAFLAWSFMVEGSPNIQWILRCIAGCAAIVGFTLAAYFAGTPEVRVKLDEDPTGFDTPITALQLHEAHPHQAGTTDSAASKTDRTWSELNIQH